MRDKELFHTLAHVSGKTKTDRMFVKILSEMYLWSRKSPLDFGIHLNPDSD